MADPTDDASTDPFQAPPPRQEPGTFPHQGDPRIGPTGSVSYPAEQRQRNGLAVAVILGLAVVAVAALGVAGYLVWQGISATSESWDSADRAEQEARLEQEPKEFPTEITDLDALTATPGETFTAASENLIAGEDIAPGVYVAPDAVSRSEDDLYYCTWSVSEHGLGKSGGFSARGSVDGGTAMMMIPAGYSVRVSESCGIWEAVDPAIVFEGATGTELGDYVHVVGYDLKPGMYVSDGPVARDAECAVWVRTHFGFENVHNFGEFHFGSGGVLVVELEAGDFVSPRECPTFTWADPETVYSADAGVKSIGPGTWIAGLDIAPGTYQGPADPDGDSDWCYAEVWDAERDWENGEPVSEANYYAGEESETFTAELGQTVYVSYCEPWEWAGP